MLSISLTRIAIVTVVAGIGTAIAVGFVPRFFDFQIFKPAVVIWLACSALCDCLITLVLVLYLVRLTTHSLHSSVY